MRVVFQIAGLVLSAIAMSGCVTLPPALRAAPERGPSIDTARQQPRAVVGREVLWGGSVIKVSNGEDGVAQVWVLSRPLYRDGSPAPGDETTGRFIARVKGEFLDPEVYRRGRMLTVHGTIGEVVGEPVGEHLYQYPVVEVAARELWPARRALRSAAWTDHHLWMRCRAWRSRQHRIHRGHPAFHRHWRHHPACAGFGFAAHFRL